MKKFDCPPLEITTIDGVKMHVVNYPALMSCNADVYLIFGMRSFGKSYGILEYCLKEWLSSKKSFVMMRTIDDDITLGKARKYIAALASKFQEWTNYEKELTVYNGDIITRYFTENKTVMREKVGSVMSLSGWLKYKGNNYDDVNTIIFEEFLERKPKLSEEAFIEGYLNNLSTIIRLRQNVKVFCLANTVKKKSPIFDYYHIDLKKIKKGVPALFVEENGLRVCVYWTPDVKHDKQSVKHYTVSDTRSAKMITSGEWEENNYPIKWGTIPYTKIMDVRRYRDGLKIFISDMGFYVVIPIMSGIASPVLFTKTMEQKENIALKMTMFKVSFPTLFIHIQKQIIASNVIHDGKCSDNIESFIDKRLI